MEIKLKVMAMPIRMLWMNRYANIYQSVGFDGMYLIHANTAAFEKTCTAISMQPCDSRIGQHN